MVNFKSIVTFKFAFTSICLGRCTFYNRQDNLMGKKLQTTLNIVLAWRQLNGLPSFFATQTEHMFIICFYACVKGKLTFKVLKLGYQFAYIFKN